MRIYLGIALGVVTTAIVCLILYATAPAAGAAGSGSAPPEGMTLPSYNDEGQLIRPEGYRSWIFVGASLGLSYSENSRREGPGLFHNVYMQPEAFRHYADTGEFPEKVMLVMENFRPGSKESINQQGYFEKDFVGMEVALKDSETFEDGWAYFNFTNRGGALKDAAGAFPKATCFQCHLEHGADDNVFVQFYPVLRAVKDLPEEK